MASLQQIISWFKEGLFPTEDQFRQTWLSYWHKSEKIPQSQVFGLKETIESATRGLIWHSPVQTVADLYTTYPNPQVGWAALVKSDRYVYSYNGTTWANTGLSEYPENGSFFYDCVVNEDKDFPCDYDSTAPTTGGARSYLLNASIEAGKYYRINYSYINRSISGSTGKYDNCIGFSIFEDDNTYVGNFYFNQIEEIAEGRTGIVTLFFYIDNLSISIRITLFLDKIRNTPQTLGNTSDQPFYNKMPFSKLVYNLCDSTKEHSSLYYDSNVNVGKDFPAWIDPSVSRTNSRVVAFRNMLLAAEVVTGDSDTYKYTYELAYLNRTPGSDTENLDNAVQVVRRLRSDLSKIETIQTIGHLTDIQNGNIFWLEWKIGNAIVRFLINAGYAVSMPQIWSNGNLNAPMNDGKQYIANDCYIPVPDITMTHDSCHYDADVNSGKDFPDWIDSSVDHTNGYVKSLQNMLLAAEVVTSDSDTYKYTYELAYLNRTPASNTGAWDNTVQLIRRLRSDTSVVNVQHTIRNIVEIQNGEKFWLEWKIDNAIVRFFINPAVATAYAMPQFWSNGNAKCPMNGGKHYVDKNCYIPIPSNNSHPSSDVSLQVVKVVGDNLYVGTKFDSDNDITIWFKKCMFNDLMTFYRIGLAANKNISPLNNPDRTTLENLNVSSSDNIGPINISGGGWTGANHSYRDQGVVKTAENISYSFYADGRLLKDGDIVSAKIVEVRVKNRIYNPLIPPAEGDAILTSELCIEDVVYRVENGNIFVSLNHTYSNAEAVTVANYYGMQSMCVFESEIMTPNGAYKDFTASANVVKFNKVDYPFFNRFVERNSAKTRYQSSYLLPTYGMGDHNMIDDADFIFTRGSGKCYHHCIGNRLMIRGDVVGWTGLYTWFVSLQDNNQVLVYIGNMNGNTYLFIDAKIAVNMYISVPTSLVGKAYEIVEVSESITVGNNVEAVGIKIESSGVGSVVLKF